MAAIEGASSTPHSFPSSARSPSILKASDHISSSTSPHSTSAPAPATSSANSGSSTTTRLPAPLTDSQGRILNPRSCVTCRKRKVKCDKLHPCSNCSRAHIECVFPTPGRAPRKVRKTGDGRDAELLARLRRLEGVVKGLGVEVGKEDTDGLPEATKETRNEGSDNPKVDWQPDCVNSQHGPKDVDWMEKAKYVDAHQRGGFENRFGRLVINEGRSRYINSSFWANLSNEVEDLKGILNEATDDEEDNPSPSSQNYVSGHHQGWIFSFSSHNVDLLSLHPIPMQLEIYWRLYKENVDPLVKVLHIPTIEPTILTAASHLANLSRGFEALLFAIYYGAATSLSADDCITKLGEEKNVLLARYRFAIEQALARANFLITEEIVVLQAFVIFLICLRRNSDAKVIWTLTGLIVRMAQTIGIHRDGTHFGLPPFEIEMRRRLWWQICVLDVRASEDHGCDPTIVEQAFDTKLPLNINDADVEPGMKEFPPERVGITDMSFCLIRFEVSNTFRRLNYIPPGNPRSCGNFVAGVTLEAKEKWITDCHKLLEEKYLKNLDMSIPMYWVTATVARLIMSKMWLMVYHPFQRQDGGASLTQEIKDKLFITSLENIEYSLLLETEARTMKWGWLFRTYMQWHALAYILSELCHRTRGDLVERAWIAVEKTRDGRWDECSNAGQQNRSGHLWRPLFKLITKAQAARNQAIKEDAALARGQASPLEHSRSQSASSLTMLGSLSEAVRPRMTRAPLSHAQIQRFMTPPQYGSEPLDATELLKSPKLQNAVNEEGLDLMDTSAIPPDPLPQTKLSQPDHTFATQPGAKSAFNFATTPLNQQPWGPRPPNLSQSQSVTGISANMKAPIAFPTATSIDFKSNVDAAQTHNPPTGMSPFNNGEIDWANWDQLVRQFGMDVDTPLSGQPADWAGPNWNNAGGMPMGMGMGQGDWF